MAGALAGSSTLAKPNNWYPITVLHIWDKAKATENTYSRHVGSKTYELSDHLGNVTVTVSDLKRELPNTQLAVYGITAPLGVDERMYAAQVLSYSNYYAFGMMMPGRSMQSASYRYGFNGKENDKEWGTGGLTQDYGFRMYNPAIAKFLSVDPLADSYPWYTPYQFAGNKPIKFIDLDGLEEAEKPSFSFSSYLKIPNWKITEQDLDEEPNLGDGLSKAQSKAMVNGFINTWNGTVDFLSAPIDNTRAVVNGVGKGVSYVRENGVSNTANSLLDCYDTARQDPRQSANMFGNMMSGLILAPMPLPKVPKIPYKINIGIQLNTLNSGIPLIVNITRKIKGAGIIGKCDVFAQDFMQNAKMVKGAIKKHMRLDADGHIMKYGDEIISGNPGRKGATYHEWVEVTKDGTTTIFDNVNHKGVPAAEWWSKFDAYIYSDPAATGPALQKYAQELTK